MDARPYLRIQEEYAIGTDSFGMSGQCCTFIDSLSVGRDSGKLTLHEACCFESYHRDLLTHVSCDESPKREIVKSVSL